MIYPLIRNSVWCSISRSNSFKKVSILGNVLPALQTLKSHEKIRSIARTKNSCYLFMSPLMLFLNKIKLRKMDDVTELAYLAEEQASCEENKVKDVMDFEEEFSASENESEMEIDESITIEKVPYKDNHFQHSFSISRHCYKHIVGKGGMMLQKLCRETKTVIRASKKKKHVVITSSVQKRIFHARSRINKLIETSDNKSRFTHFISIPANFADIKENFIKFKEDVLKNCDVKAIGLKEGMFQKPEKLHLTICMLHLLDEASQQKAIEALNNCKKNVIEPILKNYSPISMEFKGLKSMGNNHTKARVLYMKVHEESGFLQKMADSISDYFLEQGLTKKEHENVTLHMTIMNTFYLKNKNPKSFKKNFDATELLEKYENTSLGKINLSTFHISKLTAKSPDGYFQASSKIEF